MAGKTLIACDAGVEIVGDALVQKAWSQATLAKKTVPLEREGKLVGEPISTKTIQNFLNKKPVSVKCFRAICDTLELDWEMVAGLRSPEAVASPSESSTSSSKVTTPSRTIQIQIDVGENHGTVIPYVEGDVSIANRS